MGRFSEGLKIVSPEVTEEMTLAAARRQLSNTKLGELRQLLELDASDITRLGLTLNSIDQALMMRRGEDHIHVSYEPAGQKFCVTLRGKSHWYGDDAGEVAQKLGEFVAVL